MKELNLFSDEEQKTLRELVESSCHIVLPQDKQKMGTVTFHLYHYQHNSSDTNIKQLETNFQIRWGVYTLFQQKHLILPGQSQYMEAIKQVIIQNCSQIRQALHKYCEEQLSSMVPLALEPEINSRIPYVSGLELKVCQGRQKYENGQNSGWPNYCILIAWYDELGEFQEFIYPIKFEQSERSFPIPVEQIVDKFQIYRDTVI